MSNISIRFKAGAQIAIEAVFGVLLSCSAWSADPNPSKEANASLTVTVNGTTFTHAGTPYFNGQYMSTSFPARKQLYAPLLTDKAFNFPTNITSTPGLFYSLVDGAWVKTDEARMYGYDHSESVRSPTDPLYRRPYYEGSRQVFMIAQGAYGYLAQRDVTVARFVEHQFPDGRRVPTIEELNNSIASGGGSGFVGGSHPAYTVNFWRCLVTQDGPNFWPWWNVYPHTKEDPIPCDTWSSKPSGTPGWANGFDYEISPGVDTSQIESGVMSFRDVTFVIPGHSYTLKLEYDASNPSAITRDANGLPVLPPNSNGAIRMWDKAGVGRKKASIADGGNYLPPGNYNIGSPGFPIDQQDVRPRCFRVEGVRPGPVTIKIKVTSTFYDTDGVAQTFDTEQAITFRVAPNKSCPTDCAVEGQLAHSSSTIDNGNLTYRHEADDYAAAAQGGGCAPCGGSALGDIDGTSRPSLRLRRIHRYDMQDWPSSYGPGVFSGYDLRLRGAPNAWTLWDPSRHQSIRLSSNGQPWVDPDQKMIRDVVFYDASGAVVYENANPVKAVLTELDGRTVEFELIPAPANDGLATRYGRPTRLADPRGLAVVITYVHPRSATDVSLGGDRALLWKIASITDAYGLAATPAYRVAPVGIYPTIASTAIAGAGTLTYSYRTNGPLPGLASVAQLDGSTTTVDVASAAAPDEVDVTFSDPTVEGMHRSKIVTLTAPSSVIGNRPWRIRQVRKASGSLVYRSRETGDDAGNNVTLVQDGERVYRYVTDGGAPRRIDYLTSGTFDTAMESGVWQTGRSWATDNLQRIIGSTDGLGQLTATERDAATGQPKKITYPGGSPQPFETFEYDTAGNRTAHVDRLGKRSEWTYDAKRNRMTEKRAVGLPEQSNRSWTYHATTGALQTATDPLNRVTTYIYDAVGRLERINEPPDIAGGTVPYVSFGYDARNRIAWSEDQLRRRTNYFYDGRNRLVNTTYADGSTETSTYGTGSNAGRVVSTKDRNGNVKTFTYDADGRRNVVKQVVTRADGSTEDVFLERVWYTAGSELAYRRQEKGSSTSYAYDAQRRIITRTAYTKLGAYLQTTYLYDAAGRQVRETDPYGRRTFSVYDALGRLIRTVRETVANGVSNSSDKATLARSTSLNPKYVIEDIVYDLEGRVVQRIDGRNFTTEYAYDGLGRMTRQTEALGRPVAATTVFAYDAAGNQTRIEHPRHLGGANTYVTLKTYTDRNLLKTVTEAAGRTEAGTTTYGYTLDRRVATVQDARGNTTTNTYGTCCARLMEVADPSGALTKFTYDFNGNRKTVTDANNLVTTSTYDGLNRPLTRIDALGKVWTTIYDDNLIDGLGLDAAGAYGPLLTDLAFGFSSSSNGADGSAVAVRDPNGNERLMVADGLGRTVRSFDALRRATSTVYDAAMTDTVGTTTTTLLATTVTDPLLNATTTLADGLGLVRVQIDGIGQRSRSTYDANGNRRTFRDADGIGPDWTYDERNREATCNDPARGASSTAYDTESNVVRRTDAQSAVEIAVFDGRNRKTGLVDRIAATTAFTYDAVGNLLTITDDQNGVTTYTYDTRNLLLTETFPGTTGGTRTYTYDGGRRLKTRKDQTNLVTTYVYDDANRLVMRSYPDAKNDSFFYDPAGRLTKAVSGRYGTTVDRTYDACDRQLTDKTGFTGENWTVTGAYDFAGRLTGLTLPDGTPSSRTYTARGELLTAKLDTTTVATRSYTVGGRLAETQYGNTRIETRTYGATDGLVMKIVTPGVADFSYTYDSLKRKTAEIDLITPSNTQRFSYDAADRLTLWDRISGTAGPVETQQSWTLSSVGDWTSTTKDGVAENRTHTPVHEIAAVNGTALTHDAKGNLTRDQQAQLFTWDVENRLATAASLVQQSGQTAATYAYDALGRRVRKTVGTDETTWISWGAQEVYQLERNPTAIAADQPPTTPTAGGAVPSSGGSTYPSGSLLMDAAATRISFQSSSVPIPAGWLADTGSVYGARTGGATYGWVGAALSQTINREWIGWYLYDAFNQPWTTWQTAGSARATWEIALPNGTYPMVLVCGDARSIQQRNDFLVEGAAWNDPSPWDGVAPDPTTGQRGKFVRLSGLVTVADGKLTLTPATTAKAPKLCFLEIGAVGTAFDANFTARSTAALATVNSRTATGRPLSSQQRRTLNVYGTYVDELLGYRVQQSIGAYSTKTTYWTHSNHLYSLAAVTNSTGAVVERYAYTAYGQQTVKNGGGSVIGGTAVGQARGFTGYRGDSETAMYYVRARMYSSRLGRFVSRDPLRNASSNPQAGSGYKDGFNFYAAYYVPNHLDPNGTNKTGSFSRPGDDPGEIYETARIAVTLKEDVSACGMVPDASKGDPKDPKCPKKCDGKVKVSMDYLATLSTDDTAAIAPGSNFGLENAGTFARFGARLGPVSPWGRARGTVFSRSISLGEIDCTGGALQGIVRVSVGVGAYTDHLITWSVNIESCGIVKTETLSLGFAPGTRATSPFIDLSGGAPPYPPAPPGNTSRGPVGGP